jgi:uncharacterized protein YciI
MESYFLLQLKLAEKYSVEKNWTEIENDLITQHFHFLTNLANKGVLLFAGRTNYDVGHPDLEGFALIKATNLQTAEDILKADPAVVAGLQIANIHPFSLAIEQFNNKID